MVIRTFSYIYLLTLVLLSKTLFSQVKLPLDSLQTGKNISFQVIENNEYRNMILPSTISNLTKVYSQPDTNSVVLSEFKISTYVRILGEGIDTKEIREERIRENGEKYTFTKFSNLKWYKIELKERNAYIKASDVATHRLSDNKGLFEYFFIAKEACYLFKYDNKKKQFVDSIKLTIPRPDIVQSINSNGWKNVNMLFRATIINAYCGGGTTNVFIVDANGKLSELITTSFSAEAGGSDFYSSNVWLPIKFTNEKVLHVANGDLENVFDKYSGKLNTLRFPKEIKTPKMELVIFKEREGQGLYNENYEPLLNKDGSAKSKIIKNSTKYLRWNGVKLVAIN